MISLGFPRSILEPQNGLKLFSVGWDTKCRPLNLPNNGASNIAKVKKGERKCIKTWLNYRIMLNSMQLQLCHKQNLIFTVVNFRDWIILMEVPHQVSDKLNFCIALNLGKMFKSRFFEKSD